MGFCEERNAHVDLILYRESATRHHMHPPNPSKRWRAIIADDDLIFRYTLRALVEQVCEVVDEAQNGLEAIQSAEVLHPDLVFLDISMPVLDGFQAAAQFRKNLPTVRIIFVSSHSERAYVEKAFESGGEGYVFKGSAAFQIPQAIEAVMGGRTFRAGY
jgi:DNA-binding NarL/FixJ family response regulator